ncbi:MAG: hypothetical protein BAJATHORv1_40244 [Candidatus Thorarchaeota archaeon]|nr:MAG: hypothetical protein BAJATHORv1_40244 [Candidatus Thorarchaeota archaeon]
MAKESDKKPNRLIDEKSPYLQQHAYNPVDWYPWSDEAFETAKKQDKPIFLSIGYSTCHWCHVFEHESFEDPEIAKMMNETFINIKVDREERPDIDKIYMQVAQMMTGRGGWPLTIIMTPDKEPFFAATYIPKEDKYGQMGMKKLIPAIEKIWEDQRYKVEDVTKQIRENFSIRQDKEKEELDRSILRRAYDTLLQRFDSELGGFGIAPKFPSPHNLLFLLRYWKETGEKNALAMVEKTLTEMRKGGVYDQIGFGFHRYSTDREWLLPHFEKMIYDQAMLIIAYSEAYQITGEKEYAETVREIVTYVNREMTSDEGLFYTAQDADSEGEEGKFYVWAQKEIEEILEDKEFQIAKEIFNIKENGNFLDESSREPTGMNIPHLIYKIEVYAKKLGMDKKELSKIIETIREKLFRARKTRVHPLTDDKILADMNGLMIAALAYAGRVLGESEYIKMAENAADMIAEKMYSDDILYHRMKDDEITITGFLDDYAFLLWGFLETYQASLNPDYLELAKDIAQNMLAYFWDEEQGALFFTADHAEDLLTRQKDAYDGAIPSGNSVASYNLVRLARLIGQAKLEDKASEIIHFFSTDILQNPTAYTMMLNALSFLISDTFEVVIAGRSKKDISAMVSALNEQYLPHAVIIARFEESKQKVTELAPYTKYYEPVSGQTAAHVCINQNCQLPIVEIEKMLKLLKVQK